MAEHVYLLTILLPLGTILIVFAMKYAAAALQARTTRTSEQAYRTLAEESISTQHNTAAALTSIKSDLARLSASLASIEAMLKQVG